MAILNNLTHEHIAYLHKLSNVAEKFNQISATRMKLVMDMASHGLIRIENDFIFLEEKAKHFIAEVEHQANEFLRNHG